MYDVGATISEGVRMLPKYLCTQGLAAVRLNDVNLFFDRGHPGLTSRHGRSAVRHIFNASLYEKADFARLLQYNLERISLEGSPLGCLRESMAVKKHFGDYMAIACAFASFHMVAEHVPTLISSASHNVASTTYINLLRLLGLHVIARNESSLVFAQMPFCEHVSFLYLIF